jgi:hypothetical protein
MVFTTAPDCATSLEAVWTGTEVLAWGQSASVPGQSSRWTGGAYKP